ncbi:hypothetical protein EHF33_12925 [Deinococcus psychrotolerans]|uniref:Uncharacterized protein n=2 Tax=Deinococcus TaxID=1298 RepID=A0A553V402_9DEIO|nr:MULTISPECIES: hypothetical protein [Deinococcus]AZI43539.1 hypothetical protein EHF33_12925 [Deinococcus psychrotolerans]TSA87187.1 hypothetical protein FNU79_04655 [Deinococcus detaillensis]
MDNRTTSNVLTVAGFVSIVASIIIWFTNGGKEGNPEERAHGERFGIFVGLWAPTFFVLANKYNELAAKDGE